MSDGWQNDEAYREGETARGRDSDDAHHGGGRRKSGRNEADVRRTGHYGASERYGERLGRTKRNSAALHCDEVAGGAKRWTPKKTAGAEKERRKGRGVGGGRGQTGGSQRDRRYT